MKITQYDYDTLQKLLDRIQQISWVSLAKASDITSDGIASIIVDPKALGQNGWTVRYPYSMHFYGKVLRKKIKAFGLKILKYSSPKKFETGHVINSIQIIIKFT